MKIIFSFLIFCIILPCRAQHVSAPYSTSPVQNLPARDTLAGELIVIPVVIHVLFNNSTQNISDAQVVSQIESLNKDYRRLNDISKIPAAFASLSADSKITFCIAKTDPSGKPTTGIIHKYTKTANWTANDQMKFSASGGDDVWDSKRYLNIWVCNLFSRSLGYSSLPGSPADKDGVVIQYDVFGTRGTVRAPFDKGRTATHEIGHWLGLLHLWGDALCGDDKINDTPPQRSYNNGCPSFPHISSCSKNENGDLFMDFMDFTDDGCMSMFTHGQASKMRSLFAAGNARNSFLNSSVCNSPSPEEGFSYSNIPVYPNSAVITKDDISLYPNPARGYISVKTNNGADLTGKMLVIYNMMGIEVNRQLLTSERNAVLINKIPAGIYTVKIGEGKEMNTIRLIKQ